MDSICLAREPMYYGSVKKIKDLNEKKLELLYEAILQLKTAKECRSFFRDLCTTSELQEMSERFEVAKLVDQGVPYREIAERTGVSTATITRVAQWLNNGEGGYKEMIERLKKSPK